MRQYRAITNRAAMSAFSNKKARLGDDRAVLQSLGRFL
jgi:hypothetical protein